MPTQGSFGSSSTTEDFWRSGVGAITQPDGTTDVTENIRRNGFVGINNGPVAMLDVGGICNLGGLLHPAVVFNNLGGTINP